MENEQEGVEKIAGEGFSPQTLRQLAP